MKRRILGFLVMFVSILLFGYTLKQTIVFFGVEWQKEIAWNVTVWSGMIYHWIVSPREVIVQEIEEGDWA